MSEVPPQEPPRGIWTTSGASASFASPPPPSLTAVTPQPHTLKSTPYTRHPRPFHRHLRP